MAIPTIMTKLPTIPSEDFTKGDILGKGGFGQVYLGSWHATPIAVKELLVQTISEAFLKTFQSEAQIMAQCQHPNTVRLFGVCLEKGKLALIMEYLEKGSLYNMLGDTDVPIAWTRRFSIAADIGKGLAYLHSQNILHRDLKSLNILIDKFDVGKITDFGFAKIKLESSNTTMNNQQGGTVRWTAPELFQPKISANTASDVYSFGMVLWEIAARQVPFSNAPNDLVMYWKSINVHEIIPEETPPEYARAIKECWKDPSARPTAYTLAQSLLRLTADPDSLKAFESTSLQYHSNTISSSTILLSNEPPSSKGSQITTPPSPSPGSPSAAPTVDAFLDHLYSLLENENVQKMEGLSSAIKSQTKRLRSATMLIDQDTNIYRISQKLLDSNHKVRKAVAEDFLELVGEKVSQQPIQTNVSPPVAVPSQQVPPPVPVGPKLLLQAALPSIAFGKAEWAKYFGDVGVEPPLPADINATLAAPCPFWPGKKVQETHLLVLVPQTVNGKPLSLKTLGDLIQKPLQGTPTKYRGLYLGEYTDPAAPKSHWALMTRDVIEGSRKKSYKDQQALIKAKALYEVPTLLDATAAILMEHVRTGTRLYSDSPYTYTRCQEKYNKDYQSVVGGFSAAGLYVHNYSGNDGVGVAGPQEVHLGTWALDHWHLEEGHWFLFGPWGRSEAEAVSSFSAREGR